MVALPDFVLIERRVANDSPAAGVATPASALRFEPRVDFQTRNFGELQGDISIRGGIFEGTAVQIEGLTLFDPQTGHYTAEIPIEPAMLAVPRIVTGLDHALGSFNATVGTVAYEWRPIESRGEVSLAGGRGQLDRESIYAARVLTSGDGGRARVAVDGEISRSEAEGTVPDGDHRFFRAAGRFEVVAGTGRTEVFAGYQSKFFGWPNLYTPFGVAETENLQTTLLVIAHRLQEGERVFEIGADFRRNRDDYEFNRYQPGAFNPYQHETRVTGSSARLSLPVGGWTIDARAEVAADSLTSTSLTTGRFMSRSYWKLAAAVLRRWRSESGMLVTRFGAAYDDTNRDSSALSPGAELAWETNTSPDRLNARWYAQASRSTRVPGYTALNSSPAAGLFRGNSHLGREKSRNLEAGLQLHARDWSLHAAVFQRHDDPLVDWTYANSLPNARSANAVQIDTVGFEVVASHSWSAITVVGGYTWLSKDADYRGALVDASFYALNFPRHRATLALTARLGGGFEIRSDNEFRAQQENVLRKIGGTRPLLSSLGLYWIPPGDRNLELSLVADNLWASDFQEIPAVRAPGRQITAGFTRRW